MKYLLFVLPVAAALVLSVPLLQSQGDEPATKKLMSKKLESAQNVLTGLSINDYDLIARSADDLIQVSKTAEWSSAQKSPQYEVHGNDFRRTAEALIEQAKAKNSEGVAIAFADMTLTCVRCHKQVREVRVVSADGDR